ncbi:MAG: hypothetical protein ACTSPA_15355, partial [Promethearchaeota archaeon]
KKAPVACILISSSISKTLRNSFNDFSMEVFSDYQDLKEKPVIKGNYEKGDAILANYFPFVPHLG